LAGVGRHLDLLGLVAVVVDLDLGALVHAVVSWS
jgi:hypothetical protein